MIMESADWKDIDYSYADPTGNITILVRSFIPVEKQPELSAFLCSLEPACEQVGFIYYGDPDCDIRLRMAGGEFCGNAVMSAAALFARENGAAKNAEISVSVRSSGSAGTIPVRIRPEEDGSFTGTVKMPLPDRFETVHLFFNGIPFSLPLVRFSGICHLIFPGHFPKEDAERAVVQWARDLDAPALGLIQLDEKEHVLTPLVFVPSVNTLYWEHSCASGTAAAAYYLSQRNGNPLAVGFKEPGGVLKAAVTNDHSLFLSGHVRFRD